MAQEGGMKARRGFSRTNLRQTTMTNGEKETIVVLDCEDSVRVLYRW